MPRNTRRSLGATRPKVFFGDDERDDMLPLQIERYLGGQRNHSAVIQFTPVRHDENPNWNDSQLSDLFSNDPIVEITIRDNTGKDRLVHFGKIFSTDLDLGPDEETCTVESRLEDHMIGRLVTSIYNRVAERDPQKPSTEPRDRTQTNIVQELVFNPLIDGVAVPNCYAELLQDPNNNNAPLMPAFVDPRSVEPNLLTESRRGQENLPTVGGLPNQPVTFWSLPLAVHYLINALNDDEKYIENPTLIDLNVMLTPNDQRELRDFRIPAGLSLPQSLDKLLTPLGYEWEVFLDERNIKPKFKFRKRSKSPVQLSLRRQPIGDAVENNLSNAPRIKADFDIADNSATIIGLYGTVTEFESSFILRPAWEERYDSYHWQRLNKDAGPFNNEPEWRNNPALQDAWRKFVLNEGGDYTGKRPWFNRSEDFAANHGFNATTRRRRFFPCITLAGDGTPIGKTKGIHLEWWDEDNQEWKNVIGGVDGRSGLTNGQTAQILENECGIRFTSPDIPLQLKRIAGVHGIDKVMLRATASVRTDETVFGTSVVPQPFLQDPLWHVETSRAYSIREIKPSSIFFNDVHINQVLQSRTTNNQQQITAAANTKRLEWQKASISGAVTLEGIHWPDSHVLGVQITGVDGRNIGFKASPPGEPDAFPTITGITLNVDEQETILHLDFYRSNP